MIIDNLNLRHYFKAVYHAGNVQKGKPDPEGIFAAMDRYQANSAWMVGDNVDDILAAKAAGAVPIGIGPNAAALTDAGAAFILDDINDLEELL